MVVWDAAGRLDGRDTLRFSAAEAGEPNLGHIAENQRVQWALYQSQHVREVTQLRAGLESLEFDDAAARVVLSDGRRYDCALVVGADGGQSRTRQLCGIGRAGWSYVQVAVVAHLRTERPHRETAWQGFLPDGPIAVLPLGDGRVSLVWTTSPADAEALQAIEPRLSHAASPRRATACWGTCSSTAPVPACRSRCGTRGNTSARVSRWRAMRRTPSIRSRDRASTSALDCASLVEVLGDAVAAGDDPFELRALGRYERWRRSENALMLGVCDTINRLFTQKSVSGSYVMLLRTSAGMDTRRITVIK